MRKLASYIMAGWPQATTAVVGFAVLALIVPPLSLLSGAALALVTLRVGARHGATVLGLSSVAMVVLSMIASGRAWPALAFCLVEWVPVLGMALALRFTVSLSVTLQGAVVVAMAVLLGVHAVAPDVTDQWMGLLNEYMRPAMGQADIPAASIDRLLERLAGVMTGVVVASMLISLTLSVFIARWWQALLYNPGGFKEEFLSLRLGYAAAGLGVALFVGALLLQSPVLTELTLVALAVFFLQGIAVIHNLSARTKNPALWLIGAYGLVLLAFPQMTAALAALGVMDSFVNIRSRWRGTRQGNG